MKESDDHNELAKAIRALTRVWEESSAEHRRQFEWMVTHSHFITKSDFKRLEENIMSKLDDLISASTTLSTASDGLSIKLDTLVTKIDAVVLALQNTELPPAGEAAINALKAAAATATAAGAKVDSEVTKLDGVLPAPAPAAPIA
jgi:hypothetical protein